MKCRHPQSAVEQVSTRCYSHPVSRDENPAAHGWITALYRCGRCGKEQLRNENGWHEERGPWFEPAPPPLPRPPKPQPHERSQNVEDWHTVARAYGISAQSLSVSDVALAHLPNDIEIVVGLDMADAARRTRTADADIIRGSIADYR